MNRNLELITKKCQESNPEIMKLEDGCWIKIWWMDNQDEREEDEKVMFTSRSMRNNGDSNGKYNQIIEDNVCGTVEILGRNIELADVLMALYRVDQKLNEPYIKNREKASAISVDTEGLFFNLELWNSSELEVENLFKWDLTKPLHLQKPEVWNFLAILLKD